MDVTGAELLTGYEVEVDPSNGNDGFCGDVMKFPVDKVSAEVSQYGRLAASQLEYEILILWTEFHQL